jgi:hypothetical protein
MSRPGTQRLADLEIVLAGAGLDPAAHAGLLRRVRKFLQHYADLERALLGSIRIAVPRHLLDAGEADAGSRDPLDLVEILARREGRRLGFGADGGRDVMSLLDHDGLKVYRPLFPEGSALRGIFLFDEEVGPAFLADGRLPHHASNAVFARLYGHYLLDHDPYEIRMVVVGDTTREARALRGWHFAVAFLIERAELAGYLQALDWKQGNPVDVALLRHLTVYFEADAETVAGRLLSLGFLDADSVRDLPPVLAEGESDIPGDEAAVPERFVRLALEAHARGLLSRRRLAAHLETDERSARLMAEQFEAGALASRKDED